MIDSATPSGAFERLLLDVRRRSHVRQLTDALAWAAAVTALGVVALLLLEARSPEALASGFPTQLAIGIGAVAIALALVVVRRPSLSETALLLDRKLEAGERFSTAHDVAQRGDHGVVPVALLSEARAQAKSVDPRQLVPFTLPIGLIFALALAATGVVFIQFMPRIEPTVSTEQAVAAVAPQLELADTERAELAADIDRVAAFMASQAEGRQDEYSAAIARTLENLSARLSDGSPLSRDDVSGELASLREYALTATNEWRGTSGQRIPELLGALAERVQQPPTVADIAPTTPSAGAEDASAPMPPSPDNAQAQQQSGGSPASTESPRADFAAMMEEAEAAVAGTSESGVEQPERVSSSYMDIALARQAEDIAAASNQAAENAQLIGPSSNAQAGDSLLAGEGTDAIGTAAVATELTFDSVEDVALEGTDTGEGQRIEKSVTPPTQRTVVVNPADRSTMDAWARSPEVEVARTTVAPTDRDLVSAYRIGLKVQAEQ